MKKWRSILISAIIVFFISIMTYDLWINLYTTSYLFIIAAVLLVCILNDSARIELPVLVGSNALAFIIVKYVKVQAFPEITFLKFSIGLIDVFLGLLIIINLLLHFKGVTKRNSFLWNGENELLNSEIILPTRKYDLDRLELYYEHDSIIGLTGRWGSGKSFIVDRFMNRRETSLKKGELEVIKVGLLEMNSNNPENVFFWSFDNILRKHGHFSRYSHAVSNMISRHDILGDIETAIFPNYEIMDDAVRNMKKVLYNLRIEVLFIIEDLDRLQDANKVKTILAFCERLSSDKIKFIIEYDEKKLKEIDNSFTFEYIEKYIPNNVDLSPVPIGEMITTLIGIKEMDFNKGDGYSGFVKIIKEFLDRLYISNKRVKDLFEEYQIFNSPEEIDIYPESVRLVMNFLRESRKLIEYEKTDKYTNDLKIKAIIGIVFIKYFDHVTFEKIKLNRSFLTSLGIEYNDQIYTIKDFLDISILHKGIYIRGYDGDKSDIKWEKMQKILRESLRNSSNEIVNLFKNTYLLGYEYVVPHAKQSVNEEYEHNNMEIDHIIKNYLFSGFSEYTNQEAFVNEMNSILDCEFNDKLNGKFDELLENLYYDDFFKNNRSIFMMKDDVYSTIVKAYLICEKREEYWRRLIDFIKYKNTDQQLNPKLFRMLSYISDFDNVNIYKLGIKLFLSFKCSTNFNDSKEYIQFARGYLKMMVYHGFILDNRFDYYDSYSRIESIDDIKNALKDCKERIERSSMVFINHNITSAVEDYKLLMNFIDKNVEVINKQRSYLAHPILKDDVLSQYSYKNQIIFQNLRVYGTFEDLDIAYQKDDINIVELYKLIMAKDDSL